jgi:isoleucyl-tRNA synthetase
MGHGLNNTLQDVMIRFERMRGREALWLPGTDHAGIATQNVVERTLRDEEGKARQDLGRAAFVERVWDHVNSKGGTILDQLKAIGASCDWSRTRFTLDEEYSAAVKRVFIKLYEDGLVYRGHRVIHWCPRCMTSLSDEPSSTIGRPDCGTFATLSPTDPATSRWRPPDPRRCLATWPWCTTPTTRITGRSPARRCGYPSPMSRSPST